MLAAATIDAAIANPLGVLTDVGVALVFVAALLIDGWNLGGAKLAPITDRIAFIGWVSVFAAGFQGSGLTTAIGGSLTAFFETLAGLVPANVPLLRGLTIIGPEIIGIVAFLIALGCLVPNRWAKHLGHFGRLEFGQLSEFVKPRPAGRTGARTGAAASAGGDTPPPTAKSPWKKLAPGHLNFGLMVIAALIVTFATVVKGFMGNLMQLIVGWSLILCADAVAPLLRSMGRA